MTCGHTPSYRSSGRGQLGSSSRPHRQVVASDESAGRRAAWSATAVVGVYLLLKHGHQKLPLI